MTEKEIAFYEDLQPGKLIRNKGTGTTYIVTETFADRAMAIRTISVHNPSEWEIIQ